jgi:hypothetical protein
VVAAKRLNLLPSKQQQEAVSERERERERECVCVCDQKANTILCTKPAPKQQQIGGAPNPKKTGARERRSKSGSFCMNSSSSSSSSVVEEF